MIRMILAFHSAVANSGCAGRSQPLSAWRSTARQTLSSPHFPNPIFLQFTGFSALWGTKLALRAASLDPVPYHIHPTSSSPRAALCLTSASADAAFWGRLHPPASGTSLDPLPGDAPDPKEGRSWLWKGWRSSIAPPVSWGC